MQLALRGVAFRISILEYKLGGVEMQLHNYIIKDGKIEL